MNIDITTIASKMGQRGFDGKNTDGWSDALLDILESEYGIEAKVTQALLTPPTLGGFEMVCAECDESMPTEVCPKCGAALHKSCEKDHYPCEEVEDE